MGTVPPSLPRAAVGRGPAGGGLSEAAANDRGVNITASAHFLRAWLEPPMAWGGAMGEAPHPQGLHPFPSSAPRRGLGTFLRAGD